LPGEEWPQYPKAYVEVRGKSRDATWQLEVTGKPPIQKMPPALKLGPPPSKFALMPIKEEPVEVEAKKRPLEKAKSPPVKNPPRLKSPPPVLEREWLPGPRAKPYPQVATSPAPPQVATSPLWDPIRTIGPIATAVPKPPPKSGGKQPASAKPPMPPANVRRNKTKESLIRIFGEEAYEAGDTGGSSSGGQEERDLSHINPQDL